MSSAADFFRKFQYIISPEGKLPLTEAADLQKAGARAVKNIRAKAADEKKKEADEKKKEADKKKAANVKESGSEFFRKYSDMIAEAETNSSYRRSNDEAEKDAVATGRKNKRDADNEEWAKSQGSKKVKESSNGPTCSTDRDPVKESDGKNAKDKIRAEIKTVSDKIDTIVLDGGKVSLTDPLSIRLAKLRAQLKKSSVAESDDRDDPFSSNYKDKGEKKDTVHKVKGYAYGGSKQKDDEKEPWHAKTEPKASKKK